MTPILEQSLYFGVLLSVGGYFVGLWLKKRFRLAIFNPLLIAVVLVMAALCLLDLDYKKYEESAQLLSWLLTPATVCLAVPLYQQMQLLRRQWKAVAAGITAGVIAGILSVWGLCLLMGLEHAHYVTFLPKSITTAIGIGVSEELGGVVTITVAAIVLTGVLGNILADGVARLFRIEEPVAKGLATGTAAHAIGTAKALEWGEVEGAMSSLAIAVAGLMTVVAAPLAANWIR